MCFGFVATASPVLQAIELIATACAVVLGLVLEHVVIEKWVRPHPLVRRYGKQAKKIAWRVGLPILFAGLIVYGAAFHSRDPDSWQPFVVFTAALLFAVVPAFMAERRERKRVLRQIEKPCPVCGYSLKENTSGICPECGTKIAWHCPRCRAEVDPSATSCPQCHLTWKAA